MTKELLTNRIDKLREKAAKIGASFDHCFYDENHLQDFWYDGNDIATIEYKNHLISFDVCGDVIIGVAKDGKSDDMLNFRHKGGGEPFFHNSELKVVIPDDEAFEKAVCAYDIVFDNNNWINIIVTDLETNECVSEPEAADECSLLEAVENNFDFYIQYIDNLIAAKSN